MSGIALPLATALVAASVTSIGIFTIRRFSGWGERNTTYFISFAAGVLVAASFLHIVPEAFAMSRTAPVWLLAGFLSLHLFHRLVTAFVCEKNPDAKDCAIGLVPMIGIGFHSLMDGFIYAIAFDVSILTGSLATLGMVLHEFPEGIITYVLLRRGGTTDRRAAGLAFVAAAATTPVGVLIAHPLLRGIDPSTLGSLLALSAGALIYVGATHLLPRAEREPAKRDLLALAGGVAVAVVIVVAAG